MNWMIDGAYGDLYRVAMGGTVQTQAIDEWDVERRKTTRARKQSPIAVRLRYLQRMLRPYRKPHQQQDHNAVVEGFVS